MVGLIAVFVLSWKYLALKAGIGVAIAGTFLFPMLMSIVPLYAGFADGDWSMLLILLGVVVIGGVVSALGSE